MIHHTSVVLAWALALTSFANAASLEKAKALRSNGLRDEAKKELVDFLYDSTSSDDGKAEALLLLGDIALDEKNGDAARENWNKLVATYPSSPAAAAAKAKLEVLEQMASSSLPATPPAPQYAPGTVLVIGPAKYDWAAPQIAGARGPSAVAVNGSLSDAMKLASANGAIVGILQLGLDVEVVFETGTLTCYRPNGAKSWDKTVRVSSPGGAEHVAHVFVNKLAEKTKSKPCP
jgi:hypothetical protein